MKNIKQTLYFLTFIFLASAANLNAMAEEPIQIHIEPYPLDWVEFEKTIFKRTDTKISEQSRSLNEFYEQYVPVVVTITNKSTEDINNLIPEEIRTISLHETALVMHPFR